MIAKLSDFISPAGFQRGKKVEDRDFHARYRFVRYLNRFPEFAFVRVLEHPAIPGENPCRVVALPNMAGTSDADLLSLYRTKKIKTRHLDSLLDKTVLGLLVCRSYDPLLRLAYWTGNHYVHYHCGGTYATYDQAMDHIRKGECTPSKLLQETINSKIRIRTSSGVTRKCGQCSSLLDDEGTEFWYNIPGYGRIKICRKCFDEKPNKSVRWQQPLVQGGRNLESTGPINRRTEERVGVPT